MALEDLYQAVRVKAELLSFCPLLRNRCSGHTHCYDWLYHCHVLACGANRICIAYTIFNARAISKD